MDGSCCVRHVPCRSFRCWTCVAFSMQLCPQMRTHDDTNAGTPMHELHPMPFSREMTMASPLQRYISAFPLCSIFNGCCIAQHYCTRVHIWEGSCLPSLTRVVSEWYIVKVQVPHCRARAFNNRTPVVSFLQPCGFCVPGIALLNLVGA